MNDITLEVWKKPQYYYCFNQVEDYFIYSRTRDNNIIENSNYKTIMNYMKK